MAQQHVCVCDERSEGAFAIRICPRQRNRHETAGARAPQFPTRMKGWAPRAASGASERQHAYFKVDGEQRWRYVLGRGTQRLRLWHECQFQPRSTRLMFNGGMPM